MVCPHCGNDTQFEPVGNYFSEDVAKASDGRSLDLLLKYSFLRCRTCSQPVVEEEIWVDSTDGSPDIGEVKYPSVGGRHLANLPAEVRKLYEQSVRLRTIDPDSYAVKVGRVLEAVCRDKGATGRSLFDQIDNLAEIGEVPDRLAEMAHSVRAFRNIGAHGDAVEIDRRSAYLAGQFVDMLLEYVYWAPAMLEELRKAAENG